MKKYLLAFALLFTTVSTFTQSLYTDDFTGGSTGWSLGMGGNFDTWIVNNVYVCASTTPDQGGGNYMHIYDDLFGDYCAHSLFAGFGSSGTVYAEQTADFSTMGYTSVNISFDWLCQGQTGPLLSSYGTIDYSSNSGASWTNITTPLAQYNGQSTWTSISFNNAAMGNQPTVRIRYGFINSGYGTDPAFAVDNISITGIIGACANVGGNANASPAAICSGNTSIITVSASTGIIQWEQSPDGIGSWINVIGGSGATTANYTTPALSTTTFYRAKLSQPSCPDMYSTTTSVTVTTTVAASVNISANPLGAICNGTNVTFTAAPTNGGSPVYQWYYGTTAVGTGSTYSSGALNNGDSISCIMTSDLTCVSGNPATSNTITMLVNANSTSSTSPIICFGESITVGSNTYNATGIFLDTLIAANSCDSIIITNLTVQTAIDTSITANIYGGTANATGVTYQWVDCDNNFLPLSGEINQSFSPPSATPSHYAVIITNGSCSDTSRCVLMALEGIENLSTSTISIYPNPSNGIITMRSVSEGNYNIVNELGQTIMSVYLNAGNNYSMQIEGLQNGIYFIAGGKSGMMKQKIIVAK